MLLYGKYLIAFFILIGIVGTAVKLVLAQSCTSSPLNEGLISALSITGASFGNVDGACVLNSSGLAAYRDFKVPTYQDLEDQFYNLSRAPIGVKRTGGLPANLDFSGSNGGDGIYLQNGDLTINTASGKGTQIIFIRGNLDITGNITYAETGIPEDDAISGLVFVVQGNINIHSPIALPVTRVNAVLISSGIICTAYRNGACLDGLTDTPQLTINGSLISLNKSDLGSNSAIVLSRSLPYNNQPAEIINKQAKYLYNLRNSLFTKDLTIITEDQIYNIPGGGAPLPPTVDIKANNLDGPVNIAPNSAATLSWTSINTTSCTASNAWSGSKSTSGSQSTGNLTTSNTYILDCTGPGGSSSDTVVVNASSTPSGCTTNPVQVGGTLAINTNCTIP